MKHNRAPIFRLQQITPLILLILITATTCLTASGEEAKSTKLNIENADVKEAIKQIEDSFGYQLGQSHWCLKEKVTFKSQRFWGQDDAKELITEIMANACCGVEFVDKEYNLVWPRRTNKQCRAEI